VARHALSKASSANRRLTVFKRFFRWALREHLVQADPTLKASVPITPWHTTKSFSNTQVPTLIIACDKDIIAPNKQHSDLFYASLNASLPRGEVDIKGSDHFCPLSLAKASDQMNVAKSAIAWLKRFVDEDTRYDSLLKGGMNGDEFIRYDIKGF